MINSQPIIEVKKLGKRYNITHQQGGYIALRDILTNIFSHPLRFLKNKTKHTLGINKNEDFWALKDVSFSIQRGEVVGVIGSNGAGKSTLLKILAGITPPTEGQINIRGRVVSLLEVGTGFHPELTGRENIFLNGAILGMTGKEIAQKFDQIVAFAGVGQFLDTPVKRYSSGMYVRLAFSVAAHMEPDVLIVDEVLAVGDAEFQKKCLGKMEEVTRMEGRTILFVSHNLGAIKRLCQKTILLDKGELQMFGETSEVISKYLDTPALHNNLPIRKADTNTPFSFTQVTIKNSAGKPTRTLKPQESFTVEVHYKAKEEIKKPSFWIDISGPYGHLFGANMLFDNLSPESIVGEGHVSCRFLKVILLPQTYTVTIRTIGENGTERLAPAIIGAASFQIVGSAKEYGMKGAFAEQYFEHDTPLIVPYEWTRPDGSTVHPAWQQ